MRALWTQFAQKISHWKARLAMFFTLKRRPFRARIIKRDILDAYRQTLEAQERKNAITQRFLSQAVDFETLRNLGMRGAVLRECHALTLELANTYYDRYTRASDLAFALWLMKSGLELNIPELLTEWLEQFGDLDSHVEDQEHAIYYYARLTPDFLRDPENDSVFQRIVSVADVLPSYLKKIPTSHPKRFYLERLAKLIGDYYYQQYQTSAIHQPDKNALTQAVKYYQLLSFNVTKCPKTYFNLANLYWIDLQDPLKALSYFEYLRDHGDSDSKRIVDAIRPRLSDAQTKRINRMPQPSHTSASTEDNQPTHKEEHNPLIPKSVSGQVPVSKVTNAIPIVDKKPQESMSHDRQYGATSPTMYFVESENSGHHHPVTAETHADSPAQDTVGVVSPEEPETDSVTQNAVATPSAFFEKSQRLFEAYQPIFTSNKMPIFAKNLFLDLQNTFRELEGQLEKCRFEKSDDGLFKAFMSVLVRFSKHHAFTRFLASTAYKKFVKEVKKLMRDWDDGKYPAYSRSPNENEQRLAALLAQLNNILAERDNEINTLKNQLSEQKAEFEQQLSEKLSEQKAEFEQQLSEKLSEQKAEFEQQLSEKLSEQKVGFEQQLSEQKVGFEQQLSEQKAKFEQQLNDQLSEQKAEFDEKFDAQSRELKQIKDSLKKLMPVVKQAGGNEALKAMVQKYPETMAKAACFEFTRNRKIKDKESLFDKKTNHFSETIPNYLRCIITQELMRDPVVTPSGHTYERRAIVCWVEKEHKDPMTGKPLSINQLIPNHLIRELTLKLGEFLNKKQDEVNIESIAEVLTSGHDNDVFFMLDPMVASDGYTYDRKEFNDGETIISGYTGEQATIHAPNLILKDVIADYLENVMPCMEREDEHNTSRSTVRTAFFSVNRTVNGSEKEPEQKVYNAAQM